MRYEEESKEVTWICLTSANLSQAAWGSLQKNDTQFMIRHFEVGVLFIPSIFNLRSFSVGNFAELTSTNIQFPIPYSIPPPLYSSNDKHWVWDVDFEK